MEKEFTVSIGWKVFYSIVALALFLMSLIFFGMYDPSRSAAILLFPLSFLSGSLLLVFNVFRRKILLFDDRILYTNFFSTREMDVAEIKGYRIGDKVIVIAPKSTDGTTLRIGNYLDFGQSEELVTWLKDNFKDVDGEDLKSEQNKILQDATLGNTTEERQAKIDHAKRIAITYNVLSIPLALAFLITQNSIVLIVTLIYPLIAVAIMASNGLIKFLSNRKRSVYAFVFIGFLFSTLMPFFSSLADYNFVSLKNLWLPFLGIAFSTTALLYFTGINRSVESVIGQIVMMLICTLLYAFSVTTQLNCRFDESSAKAYRAQIVDRYVTHGKSTTYSLVLGPWGPSDKNNRIDVGHTMYENTQVGDSVKVDLKAGLLHIPWFVVKN